MLKADEYFSKRKTDSDIYQSFALKFCNNYRLISKLSILTFGGENSSQDLLYVERHKLDIDIDALAEEQRGKRIITSRHRSWLIF